MKSTKSLVCLCVATLLLSMGLLGCVASQPTRDESVYTKRVKPISVEELSIFNRSCPNEKSNWREDKWQHKVEMANACIKQQSWVRVKEIGEDLAASEVLGPWGSYFLSLVAYNDKNFDQAEWMINLALKKSAKLGLLHYQLGRILWAKEELPRAVAAFREAIELDANLIEAHAFLANLYFHNQRWIAAAEHYTAVLTVRAKDRDALVALAEIRWQQQDFKSAISYYEQLLAAHPKEWAARLKLARLYEVRENQPELALNHYAQLNRQLRREQPKLVASLNLVQKLGELETRVAEVRARESARATTERMPAGDKAVVAPGDRQ